jgi:hypothetical protein
MCLAAVDASACVRSGRVPGIAPRHPPTPPNVRFSAFGGWTVRRSSVTSSQPVHARHSHGLGDFFVRPALGQSRVTTAVVMLCCFVCSFMARPELGLAPSRPSALGSSRLSPGLFATTASADFRSPLKDRISPGQCSLFPLAPSGSTESGLMTVGLRLYSPARPPDSASLPVRVPTVESLSAALSFGPSRFRPGHRLRLPSSTPSGTLIPIEPAPAGHTSAAVRLPLSHQSPRWSKAMGSHLNS